MFNFITLNFYKVINWNNRDLFINISSKITFYDPHVAIYYILSIQLNFLFCLVVQYWQTLIYMGI